MFLYIVFGPCPSCLALLGVKGTKAALRGYLKSFTSEEEFRGEKSLYNYFQHMLFGVYWWKIWVRAVRSLKQ